jgi:hypothetical protein
MKIPLLIIGTLVLLILVTGCTNQPAPPGNPITTTQPAPGTTITVTQPSPSATTITDVTTNPVTAEPVSAFPGSGFTPLITVTGQSGKTSDPFSVPGGYWELWYTADPLTSGGQDSASSSGSNSAVFPFLEIQVIDKTNSDRLVASVEPPGGLDKNLWQKSGIDPRPWKQKFYEGNKEYYFVITAKHLTSYTIEARIPQNS